MDGENNGKPYFLMDDLGGFNPPFISKIWVALFSRSRLESPRCVWNGWDSQTMPQRLIVAGEATLEADW